MAIQKQTADSILKKQNLTGVNAANVTVKMLNEVIDEVNNLIDGSISTTNLTLTGDLVVGDDATITGTLQSNDTTNATSKDTGAIITEGGIGVEKDVFSGGKVTATTSVVTDTIDERTAATGVTADGVLLKDSSVALADGLVSNLAIKLGADANNGLYGISDTQMGFAVEGALKGGVDTNGLFTDIISEQVGGNGVTIDGVLNKDGKITSTAPNIYSVETGITAFATGGQASATQLVEEINQIGTVATTGDSVKLPTAEAGLTITVINSDANAVNVFPFLGDTIDDNGLNNPISVLGGSVVVFTCLSGNTWKSNAYYSQIDRLTAGSIYGKNDTATKTPFVPKSTYSTLSGPGAITLTTYVTEITTTGIDAFTIANGTQDGQRKKIKMIVDAGDGTLTGSFNETTHTTIVFADAGDYVDLMWNGSDSWNVIERGNYADGITAPVIS